MAETTAVKIKGLEVQLVNVEQKVDAGFQEAKVLMQTLAAKVDALSGTQTTVQVLTQELSSSLETIRSELKDHEERIRTNEAALEQSNGAKAMWRIISGILAGVAAVIGALWWTKG